MGKRRRRKPLDQTPIEVSIEDLTHEGDGVARPNGNDGKVMFVSGALPGERVIAKRTQSTSKFDKAQMLEVLAASPDRVEPECPHFGVCGGCRLQHLSADKQLEIKQGILLDNLKRIGGIEPQIIAEPLASEPWGYRHKARLGVRYVHKKGRVLVGFRELHAPFLAEMEVCLVMVPEVGQKLMALSEMIGQLSIYRELPQIEVAVSDNVTAMILRIMQPLTEADEQVLAAFAAKHDIDFYLQPKGPDTIVPFGTVRPLVYRLPDYDVEVLFEPSDFTQVNFAMNRRMIKQALEWLNPQPDETVLELFAGLGNFTLPLAKQVQRVVSVEGADDLVQRAQANAAANDVDNIEAHVANLYEDCSTADWVKQTYDTVLLDPPRSGAEPILETVAKTNAKRILYVSCHPGTLARDAGILVNAYGYELVKAGAMDMFPHTAHVESMALFIKP